MGFVISRDLGSVQVCLFVASKGNVRAAMEGGR